MGEHANDCYRQMDSENFENNIRKGVDKKIQRIILIEKIVFLLFIIFLLVLFIINFALII